ncbi:MAG: ABC transporter permease [Crocinitomicaceae bacterium]
MRNFWLLTMREWKERVWNRTFLWMLVLGPIVCLTMLAFLFKAGDEGKSSINVLIVDPAALMDHRVMAQAEHEVHYFFIDDYVEIDEFRDGSKYQKFDAMVEINEKILINKKAFVFYRSTPSVDVKMQLKFQMERRIEELVVESFTNLSIDHFRRIKQPLIMDFRNVYDPKNESSDLESWVGFVFGGLIFLFIGIFGMTILRSTAKEKSNRIVEVLLSAVKPRQLMMGKMTGIALAALFQLFIWTVLIGIGLWVLRQTIFPDMMNPANWKGIQMAADVQNQVVLAQEGISNNPILELVYARIDYVWMSIHFVIFFIAAYYFYGAFFSMIGAMTGTESDGQQFVLPILLLLGFSVLSGYMYIHYPDSSFAGWMSYLPFTAPMVVMIKLAQGIPIENYYLIWVQWLIIVLSAFFMLQVAGKLYKNGILQFGHRMRFKQFWRMFKS